MEYYVKGPLVCLLDYANLKGKTCGTRSTCYHPNVVGSDPQGLKKSPKRYQHHYNYSIREWQFKGTLPSLIDELPFSHFYQNRKKMEDVSLQHR